MHVFVQVCMCLRAVCVFVCVMSMFCSVFACGCVLSADVGVRDQYGQFLRMCACGVFVMSFCAGVCVGGHVFAG